MKKIFLVVTLIVSVFLLVSCDSGLGYYYPPYPQLNDYDDGGNSYQEIVENPFVSPNDYPTNNISLSVNTAAYTNLKSTIENYESIDPDQVRIEELINYFDYQYSLPEGDDVFTINSQLMKSPWNEESFLMAIGIQAKEVEPESFTGNNIVFLIDTSGSMSDSNKLSLAKSSLIQLVDQLTINDRISIVTYSTTVKVLMSGKTIDEKQQIKSIINNLRADGSTAGHAGIQKAYEIAEDNFITGGQNRVILVTDGDFNVGISDIEELRGYVSEYRSTGIYFSLFGFGRGNLRDDMLEALAKAGNGVYHYIDDITSANKAFVEDFNAMMYVVARDAKAQITFDANQVLSYRLIGYENRQLTDDEFNDEYTDAGDIGSSHQITAIYEVKLTESFIETGSGEIASIELRYKDPDVNNEEQLTMNNAISLNLLEPVSPTEDLLFISSIVEFGLYLRNSVFKGTASPIEALERIEGLESVTTDDYKNQFIELLEKYIMYYMD